MTILSNCKQELEGIRPVVHIAAQLGPSFCTLRSLRPLC